MDITDKNNRIILTKNKLNNTHIGSNLYMNTTIIDNNIGSSQVITNDFFRNNNKYKNKILLSQLVTNQDNGFCFITKNNIKNNMKFIHSDSNNYSKILFIKNQDIMTIRIIIYLKIYQIHT